MTFKNIQLSEWQLSIIYLHRYLWLKLTSTSNHRATFQQRFERNNVNVLDVLPAKVFHLKWAFGGNGSHGMCPELHPLVRPRPLSTSSTEKWLSMLLGAKLRNNFVQKLSTNFSLNNGENALAKTKLEIDNFSQIWYASVEQLSPWFGCLRWVNCVKCEGSKFTDI